MKPKRINADEIRRTHPGGKSYTTDLFYTRLANLLLDTLCRLDKNSADVMPLAFRKTAITLACYLEDIVADCGIWRMFSQLCQQMYGHPVPLYHKDEEYYPDEPSLNAVRFFIWYVLFEEKKDAVFVDAAELAVYSVAAYQVLEEAFEEAPINEELASDIGANLDMAGQDFDALRSVMKWLFLDCYMTKGENNNSLLKKLVEEGMQVLENKSDPSELCSWAYYLASTRSIFMYRIGPLALYPKDYLAAMMRVKGMDVMAENVERIEYMLPGHYKYEFIAPDRLLLTRTNGKQIEMKTRELNTSDENLTKRDGCFASSIVYYLNEWHLNGIALPVCMGDIWSECCEKDPDNLPPGQVTLTADKMLERTSGQRVAYFADREQLKDFLEKKIQFPPHTLGFIDERGGTWPMIFIDEKEAKNCLQFSFGITPLIADPSNPFYNPEEARKDAMAILWEPDAISTNAVNYLLDNGCLPDIFNDSLFSSYNTPEQTRSDIDFMMRVWRKEKY